jgi:hypothetical protein
MTTVICIVVTVFTDAKVKQIGFSFDVGCCTVCTDQ